MVRDTFGLAVTEKSAKADKALPQENDVEAQQESAETISTDVASPLLEPDEHEHFSQRAPWLRAGVLGANDGLVSVASLMIGVGGGSSALHFMILAGLAGLVGGALSMAVGEFISVASQKDSEQVRYTFCPKLSRHLFSLAHRNAFLPHLACVAAGRHREGKADASKRTCSPSTRA